MDDQPQKSPLGDGICLWCGQTLDSIAADGHTPSCLFNFNPRNVTPEQVEFLGTFPQDSCIAVYDPDPSQPA